MFREWEVLDLACKELRPEAELPWTGNPRKGFSDSNVSACLFLECKAHY
jgi:hypothetical protein